MSRTGQPSMVQTWGKARLRLSHSPHCLPRSGPACFSNHALTLAFDSNHALTLAFDRCCWNSVSREGGATAVCWRIECRLCMRRPIDKKLKKRSKLPSVKKLWSVEEKLGGWDKAQTKFFSANVRQSWQQNIAVCGNVLQHADAYVDK